LCLGTGKQTWYQT